MALDASVVRSLAGGGALGNVDLIYVPEPTGIGTGVDHVTLDDNVLVTYARDNWEKIVAPLVEKLYQNEIEASLERLKSELDLTAEQRQRRQIRRGI